jgi:hypothetical protein
MYHNKIISEKINSVVILNVLVSFPLLLQIPEIRKAGWPHCFWACGKAAHHWEQGMMEQAAHLLEARKQSEREETGISYSP